MKIIFKQSNGGVAIITPASDEINPATGVAFTIQEIAARDVPTGHGYKIVQDSEVPVDRSFRDAWTVDDADLTDGTGSGESHLA